MIQEDMYMRKVTLFWRDGSVTFVKCKSALQIATKIYYNNPVWCAIIVHPNGKVTKLFK